MSHMSRRVRPLTQCSALFFMFLSIPIQLMRLLLLPIVVANDGRRRNQFFFKSKSKQNRRIHTHRNANNNGDNLQLRQRCHMISLNTNRMIPYRFTNRYLRPLQMAIKICNAHESPSRSNATQRNANNKQVIHSNVFA